MSIETVNLNGKTFKIKEVISEERIKSRVLEIADAINRDYAGESVYLVAILKGAFMFMTDLARNIKVPCECAFIGVSSYGNARTSSGKVKITKDVDDDIEGKNVIIIEDIIDTGITLDFLKEYMLTRKPKSVRICALLSKTECRRANVNIDYLGFDIPDRFVIGYGLDYEQYMRNLPYVAAVESE